MNKFPNEIFDKMLGLLFGFKNGCGWISGLTIVEPLKVVVPILKKMATDQTQFMRTSKSPKLCQN